MEPFEFINKHKKHIRCWPSGLTYDMLSNEVKVKKFMLINNENDEPRKRISKRSLK
jgi:hypothetical protein